MARKKILLGFIPLVAVVLLGLLSPCRYAGAYQVTSPGADDFCIGSKKAVRWTSVSSDPAYFSIAITNQDASTYPTALSTMLVKGIPKRSGKYELPASAIKGLKEGSGYQVNIMSLEGGAILAQSPTFTISRQDDEMDMDDGADSDAADQGRQEEVDHPSENQHHDVHKTKKGKDDIYRYQRLYQKHGKTHHDSHTHKQARPYRSRQRLRQAKAKSNALYKSTPRFDHSRTTCSRSPHNRRVAKVLRT